MHNSLIVPIYNEVENLPILVKQLVELAERLEGETEIVLVDDGSTDGSTQLLAQLAAEQPRLVVVQFRRNYGQTAAMQAGLEAARGERLDARRRPAK
jgi:glycosyltransferase involved in cell wall biosynthesis